jgi:hypothetical protein
MHVVIPCANLKKITRSSANVKNITTGLFGLVGEGLGSH